jgi:ribosomal protein S27AE
MTYDLRQISALRRKCTQCGAEGFYTNHQRTLCVGCHPDPWPTLRLEPRRPVPYTPEFMDAAVAAIDRMRAS